MKKQIDGSIKAYLLWSALILLSLLTICAIPFALAQSRSRGTSRQNLLRPVANQNPVGNVYFPDARAPERAEAKHAGHSKFPTRTSSLTGVARLPIVPYPEAPQVVLYDQLDNAGTTSVSSQDFEAALDPFDDFAADDFVVPAGQTWNISEVDVPGTYFNGAGPAASFNVFVYADSGGLPGTQIYGARDVSYVNNSGVFQVTLRVPAALGPGTYWVSVQARMDFIPGGQWFWAARTMQANSPAAWKNPEGGFGTPATCPATGCPVPPDPCPTCTDFGVRQCCTGSPAGEPDQMFRLIGTLGVIPCVWYEAESTDNTLLGSAVIQNCPTCSGEHDVGYVGNNSGTLQFNGVAAAPAGRYTVTIMYTNADAVRYALLSVNGSAGTPLSFPSTGSFQTVGAIQTTVTLNLGNNNTLRFNNPIPGDWAPDFDRLGVGCPVPTPAPTPTPTATPTATPRPSATPTATPRPSATPTATPRPSATPTTTPGPTVTPTVTPTASPIAKDFNRDGFPDYLLFNPGNLATVIWYLHNNIRVGSDHGPALPPGWNVARVADFNGDGFPDLVLFNPNTGATRIWYLRNNDRIGTAAGPTLPGGWSLMGVADFNRDGHPDYLLFNTNSLATVVWYMRNNVHVGSDHGPALPMGWSVAGLADFNGDGFPDLVLFSPTTGGSRIWYLRNNDRIGTVAGPSVPGGWILAGVADFNRNGHPDYLLFNSMTRGTVIWYMNNNVRSGSAVGPTLPSGWTLVAL
jgi:Alpha-galactosidase, CBM13 domain/FG-GAP-like repeat